MCQKHKKKMKTLHFAIGPVKIINKKLNACMQVTVLQKETLCQLFGLTRCILDKVSFPVS
jgi:hypothetical protein